MLVAVRFCNGLESLSPAVNSDRDQIDLPLSDSTHVFCDSKARTTASQTSCPLLEGQGTQRSWRGSF